MSSSQNVFFVWIPLPPEIQVTVPAWLILSLQFLGFETLNLFEFVIALYLSWELIFSGTVLSTVGSVDSLLIHS